MGNLISSHSSHKKHKGPAITDTDKAILALKTQRKKLADQQKLLEARIARHAEVARALVKEKRSAQALLALKKKKLVEVQLEQLGALQINTETMISNVENSKQQNKVFAVLQQGNDALKALQKEVTVEDVQKLMDDTAEAKAYQDEMSTVLGQSLSEESAAEAEAELDQLEEQLLQQETLEMPTVPATQVAPEQQAQVAGAGKTAAAAARQQVEEEEAEEEPAQPAREAMLAS